MIHSSVQQTDRPASLLFPRVKRKASHNGITGQITLSQIEQSILLYLEQGYSKHQAAHLLGMNIHTFDRYLRDIYAAIGVHTMVAAVAKAIRDGMI